MNFSLRGSIAALVTPFKKDKSIDFEAFYHYLDFLVDNGTDGVVVCGTSGETPTLSEQEDIEMYNYAVRHLKGKIPVIAGTGSNSTASAVKYTQNAEKAGVDAVLVVAPYYNKPTDEGIYQHFATVALNTNLPIILYNVPGRTGSQIKPQVAIKLSNDFNNIVGQKEASGNINNVAELIATHPNDFKVYSGDDNLSMLCNLLGGDGCISVAANVIPREFSQMMKYSIEGDVMRAREIFYKYHHLMDLLFIESNPIPVKAALSMMGLMEEEYRLPLCPMQKENREKLKMEMRELGIIK